MRQFSSLAGHLLIILLTVGGLAARAQGPVLTSVLPARNAVAAPRAGAVGLSFSQAITAASAAGLRVFGNQMRGLRPGTVSGGGTATLSFAPTQPFAPGERVSVTVPTTLLNAGGTGAARQVYQFTAATGGAGRGFFLDTTEVAWTSSRDQLLGDIDNDGDLDLVTSGGLFGMYSYLNNGSGTFTTFRNTVVGNTPSGATLADVNGDGYLDLLAGDAVNATVAIAFNTGTGIFGLGVGVQQLLPVGARPVAVTTGDLDGDGDLDLASANFTGNTVSVGFNNGGGLFGNTLTLAAGSQPTALQLADVDNDGDLDLVVTSSLTNTVTVRLNSGLGSFGGGSSVGAGGSPADVALADLDRDGDLDMLIANGSGASVSVRFNNGSGGFSGSTNLALPGGSTPNGLSTGDVDADGDQDFVVAQGPGGQVITFVNNGAGAFMSQYAPFTLGNTPQGAPTSLGVTLGDVDQDGDLDLITTESRTNRVVLGRDGLAPPVTAPFITGFTPGAGPVGTSVNISGAALASASGVTFNGLAASFTVGSGQQLTATVPAGASTGPIGVTTAGGTATSAQPFVVTAGPVAPVNVLSTVPGINDQSVGNAAAISVTFDAPISSLSAPALRVLGSQRRGRQLGAVSGGGTATLRLTPSPAFAPGEQVRVSIPAALTGTGGGTVQPRVVAFRAATGGTGEGIFDGTGLVSSAVPMPASDMHTADLDNDGDLDLTGIMLVSVGGIPANVVLVRFNDGSGNFAAGGLLPALSGSAIQTLPADVDGDGDFDLLVLNGNPFGANQVDTWLNDGLGRFSAGSTFSVVNGMGALETGDMDADGDLDLVYLEDYRRTLRVALNNGAGSFAATVYQLTFSPNFSQFQLADLDNDGDLDAMIIADRTLVAALNNGQGVMSLVPSRLQNMAPYTGNLAIGDLTGDGLPDLLVFGIDYNSSTLPSPYAVWPGLGNGQFAEHTLVRTVGVGPNAVQLADLNADGRLDALLISGEAGTTRLDVLLGDGRGGLQFATSRSVSAVGVSLLSPQLADFDGDGDLDLLLSNGTALTLELRPNQGRPLPTLTALAPAQGPVGTRLVLTGTNLTSARQVRFGGGVTASVTALSNTQCAVVVPAGAGSGPLTVTTPAGTATSPGPFTIVTQLLPTSYTPARNATNVPRNAAVNVSFGQALPASAAGNLVVRGSQRQGRRSGTASGAGTATRSFAPALPFVPGEQVQVSVPSPNGAVLPQVYEFTAATSGPGQGNMSWNSYLNSAGAAVGDFDEDGAPDMLCQEVLSSRMRIYFNDGLGRFGARTQTVPTAGLTYTAQVTDLDGDSHQDLLMTNHVAYSGNRILTQLTWRAGDGTGNFGSEQPLHNARGYVSPMVGDLNGDGAPDLVGIIQASDSVLVSLNLGNGTFQRQPDAAPVPGARMLRLADIDNNGTLDMLTMGLASQLNISLGTGTGAFVPVNSLLLADSGLTFDVGDLNGDGNVDLLISIGNNSNTGGLQVRFGNGAGGFGPPQAVGGSIYSALVQLADFDGDGDLDLAYGRTQNFLGMNLAFNDGTGVFARPVSFGNNTNCQGLGIADLNGDGSLDLAFAGDSLLNGSTLNSKRGLFLYFNRPGAPYIDTFTPSGGPAGTVITLTGTGFGSATSVTIGGVAVAFTVVSPTQITISTTLTTSGGIITVTSPYGVGSSSAPWVLPLPVISSFTPTSGAVGRLVTLTGAYFGGTTAVRFGGVNAPGFTVVSVSQITVLVPTGARTGPLTVVTPSGTANSAGSFTVVANPVLVSLNPARQARAAPVAGPVSLTYSAPMGAAGSTGLYVFGGQRRGRRAGTLSGSGTNTVSFVPAQPFGAGEEVSVSVPPGLRDSNGNPVLGSLVYQFRAATGGSGRGAFTPDAPTPTVEIPRQVLPADVDNDGDLDLLTLERPTGGGAPSAANLRLNDGTGRYGPARALALGTTSCIQLTLADFDTDGDLDLLALLENGGGNDVRVLLNNGTGQFAAALSLGVANLGLTAAVGDLNADGIPDLALLTQPGFAVEASTWLGDGLGGFTAGPSVAVDGSPNAVLLGDVDNDGDLDLLSFYQEPFPYGSSSRLSVRLNNGRGQLSGTQYVTFAAGLTDVALADFDGDGDLDLAATLSTTTALEVRANNGSGQFATVLSTTQLWGRCQGGPTVGDVDGDGDLDLLLPHNTQLVATLARNQGNGTFLTTAVACANRQNATSLADIDNDGDLDLLVAAGLAVIVQRNGPVPTLLPLTARTPGRNTFAAGRSAAISLNFGQPMSATTANGWAVFGNQRQGRRSGTYSGGGTAALSFAPDMSFAAGERVSVSVPATLAGTGGGQARPEVFQFTAAAAGTGVGTSFTAPTVPLPPLVPATNVLANTAADVNGDGLPDLLSVAYQTGSGPVLLVQLNTGNRPLTYAPPTRLVLGGNTPGLLTVGDVDSDGDLDVITAELVGNFTLNGTLLHVLANDGRGSFSIRSTIVGPLDNYGLQLADFDADTDLDLVITAYQGTYIRLNDGQGGFATPPHTIGSYQRDVVGPAVGDLDHNGGLDLVYASGDTGTLLFWYNNAGAAFTGQSYSISLGSTRVPKDVGLADMDADGDLDVLVLNADRSTGAGSILIYRNDGVQQFTLAQTVAIDANPRRLQIADFDHDTDPDLAALSGTGLVNIRLNPGALNQPFGTPAGAAFNPYGNTLAAVDLDGDLDLDLLMSSSFNAEIMLNGGTALAAQAAASTLAAPLQVYPNPTGSACQVQVRADIGFQAATLRLIGTLGQTIINQVLTAADNGRATLTLPALAPGLYIISLTSADGQQLTRPLAVK